ncbi:hypothetical protein BDV93DRAFT_610979 [Ceratobasidium sp. AG-I]|nr:hypothetical protein BDV93DRAFT_610979 [Ceratobasidium sp. AG-I]
MSDSSISPRPTGISSYGTRSTTTCPGTPSTTSNAISRSGAISTCLVSATDASESAVIPNTTSIMLGTASATPSQAPKLRKLLHWPSLC